METKLEAMLAMADNEFEGKSFNGPCLMETLDALSFKDAASTATYEGYSAWEIAVHCAFYKHLIARALGASVEAFPYAEANFSPLPEPADDAGWKAARGLLRRSHRAVMAAVRAAPAAKLAEIWPTWDVSFADAVAWLCTHDIYHNAQIRSMGLAGLRQPKER
jgi:uncharacterized damage-inducible protein DinB